MATKWGTHPEYGPGHATAEDFDRVIELARFEEYLARAVNRGDADPARAAVGRMGGIKFAETVPGRDFSDMSEPEIRNWQW